MPPSKRRQSNDMLYTLIVLIGLCIVAVTVAVIFYIRAEDTRTTVLERPDDQGPGHRGGEAHAWDVVGTKLPRETQLGTMNTQLDRMVGLMVGPAQPTSAEVKVAETIRTIQPLLAQAQDYIRLPVTEPNTADANAVATAADPKAPQAPCPRSECSCDRRSGPQRSGSHSGRC